MSDRKRGSLTDTINLNELEFQYEPKVKGKVAAKYASQHIIGRRLSHTTWVGGGSNTVDLEIYLRGPENVDDLLEQLIEFTEPQSDTGAPHPVYINVGSNYVGKQFLVTEVDAQTVTFEYAAEMRTAESKVKLKLEEIPISTGAIR